MLRIRFDKEAVHVHYGNGPDSADFTERYGDVEVDFMHRESFWCRLNEPLKALRIAAHLMAAVFLANEPGGTGPAEGK
jgi:hypothetical protein